MPYFIPQESNPDIPDFSKGATANRSPSSGHVIAASDADYKAWNKPSLVDLKKKAIDAVRNHANQIRMSVTDSVTSAEASSYVRKEEEAKLIKSGGTLDSSSILKAESDFGGESITTIADRVLSNASRWRKLEGQITGAEYKHKQEINKLTTEAAVLSYDWSKDWPVT